MCIFNENTENNLTNIDIFKENKAGNRKIWNLIVINLEFSGSRTDICVQNRFPHLTMSIFCKKKQNH